MNSRGFTLIELVMVIILIGVIAVIAGPRMPAVTSSNAGAFREKLRSDVRYAQTQAMTRNRRSRVYFNGMGIAPGAGYAVVSDSSAAGDCSSFAALAAPAGVGDLLIVLAAGSYTGITVTPTTGCLEYDALGRPYDCSANLAMCSPTAGGMSITVFGSGAAAGGVTVSPQTGAAN